MKAKKNDNKSSNQLRVFSFKVVAVLLPVIFIIVLEVLLRLTGYGDNLKMFVQNPVEGYEKYMMMNPEIGKKYFQKLEYTSPANDIFLKRKPANTFRIFVMGSSVVYGFPYDRNLMFSRILHQQLEDHYPDKNIEVINTSITAINSFTLLDFTDQILKYSPDAILIYEGHNEFYGAFGIGSNETMSRNRTLARIHISMMDFRFYQLIRNIISFTAEKLAKAGTERTQGTLMKRIVANTDILLGSEEYNITMDRFTQNMGDILRKAERKGVPVFFSELVSNINGMEPFNSIANDTLESAIDVFNKARLAEENQDFETALKLYYRAKDLDCLRFRASEDINSIIEKLSVEFSAIKVPMHSHFQNNTPNRLIGNNYMTEHVHPNTDGSFLMAEAFLNSIIESGILGGNTADTKTLDYYKRNWGYTDLDRLLAYHRIRLLKDHWPFIKEEGHISTYSAQYRPRTYLDSLAFSVMKDPTRSLAEVRLQLARRYEKMGRMNQAYREYESLIRMNPYIAENYRDASTCLLQLQDLPLALKYLHKSLEYENSFFAKFRIGEIYLIKGDYQSAIRYFEESFDMAPEDKRVNVLGKIYPALVYANETERAKAVAAELEKARATHFLRIPPKRYFYNDYIPFQTAEQVKEAKQLRDQNKNEEALELLESSLSIYDSHIAQKLIGEIYFSRQNNQMANYHFQLVYEEFRFDPAFLHNMVMLHIALEDFDNARKYLQGIKEIEPDYPYLQMLSMILS